MWLGLLFSKLHTQFTRPSSRPRCGFIGITFLCDCELCVELWENKPLSHTLIIISCIHLLLRIPDIIHVIIHLLLRIPDIIHVIIHLLLHIPDSIHVIIHLLPCVPEIIHVIIHLLLRVLTAYMLSTCLDCCISRLHSAILNQKQFIFSGFCLKGHVLRNIESFCDRVPSLHLSMCSDCHTNKPGSLALRSEYMFGTL